MSVQIRTSLLKPLPNVKGFEYIDDVVIEIDAGLITLIDKYKPDIHRPQHHLPNHFIMPGFVDSHIHYPQTRIIGSASGPLLPWLKSSVFPEESRFSERSYAAQVADSFCKRLLRNGTTTACIYGSAHYESTDEICKSIDHHGLNAIVGMTLMDRNAPPEICKDLGYAKHHTEKLITKWHGHNDQQIQYCVTPRFAIACSNELLKFAGDLCQSHQLWMQTHLSENKDEIEFASKLYPNSSDYLAIYADHGLLHNKSIFAHCIHLHDDEWTRLISSGAIVSHCADSNFFLNSGIMPMAKASSMGAKIAMGSDVGAGRSFSLRQTTSKSYDASLLLGEPVTPEKLLFQATAGGKIILGFDCPLQVNSQADFIVMRRPDFISTKDMVDQVIFNQEITKVEATIINGQCRFSTTNLAEVFNFL